MAKASSSQRLRHGEPVASTRRSAGSSWRSSCSIEQAPGRWSSFAPFAMRRSRRSARRASPATALLSPAGVSRSAHRARRSTPRVDTTGWARRSGAAGAAPQSGQRLPAIRTDPRSPFQPIARSTSRASDRTGSLHPHAGAGASGAHGLLSPHRGRRAPSKTHDGRVSPVAQRDVGDRARVFTLDDVGLDLRGSRTIAECVGWHVCKVGSPRHSTERKGSNGSMAFWTPTSLGLDSDGSR